MDGGTGDNFETTVGQWFASSQSIVFHCLVGHLISSAMITTECDVTKVDMTRIASCRSIFSSVDTR